jgi:hypothetical protein
MVRLAITIAPARGKKIRIAKDLPTTLEIEPSIPSEGLSIKDVKKALAQKFPTVHLSSYYPTCYD